MMQLWLAFWRLEASRRRLVAEAGTLLLLVFVGLRLVSYRRLHNALSALAASTRRAGSYGPADPAPGRPTNSDHTDIAWAIAAASRRLPIKATCLVEALASDTMLRRRRHASQLRFGVRRDREDSPLAAHAWVECEGDLVVGVMDDLGDYAMLETVVRPS